jgi:hypothetical protein
VKNNRNTKFGIRGCVKNLSGIPYVRLGHLQILHLPRVYAHNMRKPGTSLEVSFVPVRTYRNSPYNAQSDETSREIQEGSKTHRGRDEQCGGDHKRPNGMICRHGSVSVCPPYLAYDSNTGASFIPFILEHLICLIRCYDIGPKSCTHTH